MDQKKAERMIKAIAFDMDGVLIDSEPVYLKHTVRMLEAEYPQITEEAMYPTVGMRSREYRTFMADLLRMKEKSPAFEQLLERINSSCHVDYREIMRPEVPEMLRGLQDMGIKIALASSSSFDNICQVLSECGVREYFDSVISGDAFVHAKPDPEIYLCTFRRLGVRPEECLVVEDSTYGVAAGAASGAYVAALKDLRFSFDQSPADLQIDSLAEIVGIVESTVHSA